MTDTAETHAEHTVADHQHGAVARRDQCSS
jgi:hypothetical protein